MRKVIMVLVAILGGLVSIQSVMAQVPSGFVVTSRGGGVTTYKKDYAGGWPDYVTVAQLNAGARVNNIQGPPSGAPNATFKRYAFGELVGAAQRAQTPQLQLHTIMNGTFFETTFPGTTTTPITYGLKDMGKTLSYGVSDRINKNLDVVGLLCFTDTTCRLAPYDRTLFSGTTWPKIISGYTAQGNPGSPQEYTERNFFGLRDGDGDGQLDTIVFYFSLGATKQEAIDVLMGFGCNNTNIGFLDTGASTALWTTGSFVINPSPLKRTIPHAIAIYASPAVNNAAFVSDVTIPDGTPLLPGQPFTKVWKMRDIGTTTFGEGYHWTFDGGDRMGGQDQYDLLSVNPGATWNQPVDLRAPSTSGTYRGYWRMATPSGVKFGNRVWVDIRVVAMPTEYLVSETDTAPSNGAPGFWKWGTPAYWHPVSGIGYGGSMLWTYNNDPAHGIDNMGDWRPSLQETRAYEVYVYIPRNYATTTQAQYEIYHAGGRTDVIVNQNNFYDVWVSLGTYQFNAGTSGFVRLIDRTNEKYITKKIGFDAVKWVVR